MNRAFVAYFRLHLEATRERGGPFEKKNKGMEREREREREREKERKKNWQTEMTNHKNMTRPAPENSENAKTTKGGFEKARWNEADRCNQTLLCSRGRGRRRGRVCFDAQGVIKHKQTIKETNMNIFFLRN